MPRITMEEVEKGIDYNKPLLNPNPLNPTSNPTLNTISLKEFKPIVKDDNLIKDFMKKDDDMPKIFKKIILGFMTGLICFTILALIILILGGTLALIRFIF